MPSPEPRQWKEKLANLDPRAMEPAARFADDRRVSQDWPWLCVAQRLQGALVAAVWLPFELPKGLGKSRTDLSSLALVRRPFPHWPALQLPIGLAQPFSAWAEAAANVGHKQHTRLSHRGSPRYRRDKNAYGSRRKVYSRSNFTAPPTTVMSIFVLSRLASAARERS